MSLSLLYFHIFTCLLAYFFSFHLFFLELFFAIRIYFMFYPIRPYHVVTIFFLDLLVYIFFFSFLYFQAIILLVHCWFFFCYWYLQIFFFSHFYFGFMCFFFVPYFFFINTILFVFGYFFWNFEKANKIYILYLMLLFLKI